MGYTPLQLKSENLEVRAPSEGEDAGSSPDATAMSTTKTPAQKEAKALARAEYKAEGIRRAKARRRKRNQRPKYKARRFQCEMGYYECELRGYCNGDC